MTLTIETPKTAWPRHRWTTAEFDALLDGGFLVAGSKTFLWDGEIIDPLCETLDHANTQDNLQLLLMDRLPEEAWRVRPAHPLHLRDGYKPQPDLVVVSRRNLDLRLRVPNPSDAALVVEVADASYREDAELRLPVYADVRMPHYWIVNLNDRRVECYSRPVAGSYEQRNEYSGDAVIPLVLECGGETMRFGEIPVADVFRYA